MASVVAEPPANPGPDIAASMTSFMNGAPKAAAVPEPKDPTPSATPEAKAPEPKAPPTVPENVALDLSGAIEQASQDKLPKPKESAPAPETKNIKQLREQYELTKKELEEYKSKAKAQPDPTEFDTVKKDREALQTKLKEIETQRDEYAKNLAKADFRSSPAFKDKYLKPWEEAQQTALDELSAFKRTTADGKEANITWQDIQPLLTLQAPEAAAKARELFGDDYTLAMAHRRSILDKGAAWKKALDQHEAEQQNLTVERTKQEAQLVQTFENEQVRLAKQFPEFYSFDSKNEHEKKQFDTGASLAHAALFGMEGLQPEARFKAAAIVQVRASMFPVMANRIQAYEAKVKDLESQLAQARGGGPGGGDGEAADSKDDKPTDILGSMKSFLASQPKR